MHKGRLEAFSDGVIAILITIMVLDFKIPHGSDLAALRPLLSTFVCYVLSFIYIAIYWNNHHHLMQAVQKVDGAILWANMHLLFWMSLVPFVTNWMGENEFAPWPVGLYGFVLFMAAISYTILTTTLVRLHGHQSTVAKALGNDRKGKISIACYVAGIALSCFSAPLAYALYAVVALIWLIPDRRFEKMFNSGTQTGP